MTVSPRKFYPLPNMFSFFKLLSLLFVHNRFENSTCSNTMQNFFKFFYRCCIFGLELIKCLRINAIELWLAIDKQVHLCRCNSKLSFHSNERWINLLHLKVRTSFVFLLGVAVVLIHEVEVPSHSLEHDLVKQRFKFWQLLPKGLFFFFFSLIFKTVLKHVYSL